MDAHEPPPPRRLRTRAAASPEGDPDILRKAVNTLAIVPKSARITTLGRKSYNVLLFHAQDQGLDKDVFRAPLDAIIKGVDFDSNDHALIKRHLRAMVSTTVEWQSPTTGEGSSWNVSGLLAHARLSKERGQVWVEWSYAVNLKQELLQPTVFARLRLEIISQLRSHAGVALYEICTRYKEVGRTARQAWRWWQPVLSGNPPSEKTARLEYRIFKRDTLKPAIAEINTLTDIEIELVEHRLGRFVDEIQFRIQPRKQAALALGPSPQPVDLGLVALAGQLGIAAELAESLVQAHGEAALRAGLEALQRRLASRFPEPLRDPARYLRALMPGEAARLRRDDGVAAPPAPGGAGGAAPAGLPAPAVARTGGPPPAAGGRGPRAAAAAAPEALAPADPAQAAAARELQARRQARWLAEWMRRRHQQCIDEVAALDPQRQAELADGLMADLQRRSVHPSVVKRLQTSGWRHPLVVTEMVRYYAAGAHGDGWDRPSAEQLLSIAAELGE